MKIKIYAIFNKTGEFLITYPTKGMAEGYQCRMGGLAKYTTIEKVIIIKEADK